MWIWWSKWEIHWEDDGKLGGWEDEDDDEDEEDDESYMRELSWWYFVVPGWLTMINETKLS